jgi:hypothetical protein
MYQFIIAIEGITDALVAELDPAWNIKVSLFAHTTGIPD